MKLSNRKINNYTPYYIGLGIFFLLAGLAIGRPLMWIVGLIFLIIGPIKAKRQGSRKKDKDSSQS